MTKTDETDWEEVAEEDHKDHVTKEVLELKLGSLKSDLRLMIIASVALNQGLAQVQLPKGLSVAAIMAAILAPLGKGLWVFLSRG